ncbi:MAG TPA: DUF1905 domain-containing protein [Pseudonocardiaceae bacterium]|nr:DUF1905 domain-containing protein [Pseudonocardiaceae bacterium]
MTVLTFTAEMWYWRGPAPFYFLTVPDEQCQQLRDLSGFVSYGWGMIPATVTIGSTTWETSLFPKDGRYIVPVKAIVRRKENVDEGQTMTVDLAVNV